MIPVFFLILFGSFFQSLSMFKTGIMHGFGIGYWGPLARDGVWHEALVSQLKQSFIPLNPGLSGNVLINYHYFYDLLVAKISQFTTIPSSILIYQILPITFSLLMGIGTFFLAKKLFDNKFISLLSVFFVYFGSSFGWIVSLIKGQQIGGESAFWANQPVSMNLNPPYAISLVILIFAIILLDRYLKKPKAVLGFFLVLLLGTLLGFKAYAGLVILAALFCLTAKKIFFDKNYSLLPILIFSTLLTAIIYFLNGGNSYSLISIQPFWLINTMIDAGDRVGIANFTARRFVYAASHQYVKFVALELISFLIFFVGNLGTRIIALAGFEKKRLKSDLHLLILFIMIASFVPAMLFVQRGNPWNIIQFFYYFLYFASLYAASGIVKIFKLLPVQLGVLFVVVVIVITPISSIATFRNGFYPKPPAYLSKDEYEALTFLSRQSKGDVLVHPFDGNLRSKFEDPYLLPVYAESTYVAAYSGHPVYLEDVEQQIVLNTDYKVRLESAKRFFAEKNLNWSDKFLKDNNIRYIYLPKIYQLPMAEGEYSMQKIFENEGVNIYLIR
jgi:hypothetical protein